MNKETYQSIVKKPSSHSTSGQVQALLQKYSADPAFKAELDAASTREEAVQVASRHGISISTRDIAALGEASQELPDAVLDRVCGGDLARLNVSFN